jgi:AcrR family transcriptional regulator
MGRPRLIDDVQLLEAARAVFLERGSSATAGEVALRVGVSEAAVYKRFGSKQQLFLAAMASAPDKQEFVDAFRKRTAKTGMRAALIELGDRLLPFLRTVLPLLLMTWSSRGEFGLPLDLPSRDFGPAKVAREMEAFLKSEMKAGRIRKHPRPMLIARMFVGSLQHYVLLELITQTAGKPLIPPIPAKEYVRGVVDVLWKGIAP